MAGSNEPDICLVRNQNQGETEKAVPMMNRPRLLGEYGIPRTKGAQFKLEDGFLSRAAHGAIFAGLSIREKEVLRLLLAGQSNAHTVATAASLISARFANRVNNRTVGLVTGAVLTVLGAAMLILNYWAYLSQIPLFTQTLSCFGVFLAYILPTLAILISIRFLTKVPSFVFRKLLHIAAFTFSALMILTAQSWQATALACVIAMLIIYPILSICEKEAWYAKLFVQKSPGEVKRSMFMIFLVVAGIVAVAWGAFDQQILSAAAILMWGTGDAAAALVGIPLGRHKVKSKWTDGKKSWEGSTAMLLISFLSGLAVLLLAQKMEPLHAMYAAGAAAFLGTAAELFSPSEYDTITVPITIAAVLLLLV